MPPCLGGKSFVTNNDGTAQTLRGCRRRARSIAPATRRGRRAHRSRQSVNAPRSPVKCTTVPHTNAPRPCDRSKNDENVPTTDARSASLTPSSASSRSAGYISDMPAANTIVPSTSPDDRGPHRDQPDAGRDANRARACPVLRPPSRSGSRAREDPHAEDQHAVEREDRARVHVQIVDVQRQERREARQRDQAEEQHGAGPERRAVEQVLGGRRAGVDRSTSTVNNPMTAARNASPADTIHAEP